ncbi:NapC/NirT family cytochrome c [Sedimenticola sp.]|uniref:NapC/NirT family cytochrome c n=1 Tax=Sedimenticola sp. TaxID=1940285 RepID=UPI003D0E7FBB
MKRLIEWIRINPSKALLALVGTGGVAGIIIWVGFNTVMESTNTLEFCISCHEMEQLVYQEYKKSIHYKNPTGVRATCPDCHVPKDWGAKMLRKIYASKEVWHKIIGTVDTPEKFEAKRLELAEHVWATMKETDSRACRNCHATDAMDFHKQSNRAKEKMQPGMEKGKTCIDCHKGIAHKLPDDYEKDD